MRKITNEELGRPSAAEFAAMEKMPVAVVLDNVRSLQNVGAFFPHVRCLRRGAHLPVRHHGHAAQPRHPQDGAGRRTDRRVELSPPPRRSVSTVCGPRAARSLPSSRSRGLRCSTTSVPSRACGMRSSSATRSRAWGRRRSIAATGAIEIPQAGTKHSLNVSVSGGVVLWSFFRRIGPRRGGHRAERIPGGAK